MHMVEGAGGAWRRKLASGAGRAWVAALVEGARLDGDVGGGSWTEQRPVTSGPVGLGWPCEAAGGMWGLGRWRVETRCWGCPQLQWRQAKALGEGGEEAAMVARLAGGPGVTVASAAAEESGRRQRSDG
jgi:hypothetical protein